jgi:hypothetical protein
MVVTRTVAAIAVLTSAVIAGWSAIIAISASNDKETRIDEAPFVDVEFAFFVSAVSRENTKRLVSANGGISAHGLIVYGNAAVYTAPRNQVAQYVGDIRALGFESVVGSHNLPAFVLSAHTRSEQRDAGGAKKHQD